MANGDNSKLRHLLLNFKPEKDIYRSPRTGRSKELNLAIRNRDDHGKKLIEQLNEIQTKKSELDSRKAKFDFKGDYGIYVEFASERNFDLKIESLERLRSGIEVENVRVVEDITYATVYIPEGKIKNFFNIIDKYLTQNVKNKDIPKNKVLVESISQIKLATLKAFWTDFENFDNIPEDEIRWWELWLRHGKTSEEREIILNEFTKFTHLNEIPLSNTRLTFPERTIVLAKASKVQLKDSISLLNCLAEIKLPHDSPEDFMEMNITEQREWVENLVNRTDYPSSLAPAICILDSGITRQHPLIEPTLEQTDMHSYLEAWGTNDNLGHGTGMAGLALYGDLYEALLSVSKFNIMHRLESVKIYLNQNANPPELYGDITISGIAKAEIQAPQRKRVVCLAISSKEKRYNGYPSSWSSALDQVTYNPFDDSKRLVLVAAGNLELWQFENYPDVNLTESIHDPGQSWNAITVGAITNKNVIDQRRWPDYTPLAPVGGLCPASSTSCIWDDKWPIKPEIVLEGGNLGKAPNNEYDYLDSLQLLTTYNLPMIRMFSVLGDTSAATALASRIAASVLAEYPELWPESIRALLINSAEWSDSMLNGVQLANSNINIKRNLLRKYGYGIPNINKAIWSLKNNLTLISESSLQPFVIDRNDIKTNEVNYHQLPIPSKILSELGNVDVEIKITLSYFIEPNPSNRKYFGKYDYQSCGLRFDLKKGTEDVDDFKSRVNKLSRDSDEPYSQGGVNWVLGPNLRNRGSIHSDIWKGNAATLAEMSMIAVFPVTGWWRTRKQLKKWEKLIRYSLVVSINLKDVDVDIYTPISNLIPTQVSIS